MQATLWAMTATAMIIAGIAMLADRKRTRRRDPDKVGWVPWPTVLIVAIFCAAVCAGLALRE